MKAISNIVLTFAILFASAAAFAAEDVQRGIVVAIEVSDDPHASFTQSHAGASIGAALGGAVAYQAARNSDSRFAASALGTTLGGLVGNRIDRSRRGGTTYNIVVTLDSGRTVAITDRKPRVRVGDSVYMIGGNRVVPATVGGL